MSRPRLVANSPRDRLRPKSTPASPQNVVSKSPHKSVGKRSRHWCVEIADVDRSRANLLSDEGKSSPGAVCVAGSRLRYSGPMKAWSAPGQVCDQASDTLGRLRRERESPRHGCARLQNPSPERPCRSKRLWATSGFEHLSEPLALDSVEQNCCSR